jgi:succinylglutamate desuccinylase
MEWIADSHILGVYSCGIPGPLVLAMGALHDDETGSPRAIDAFLHMLESRRPHFSGTFIGMIGKLRPSDDDQHNLREDHNPLSYALRNLQQEHTEGIVIDCQTKPALTIPYLGVNANPRSTELARKFPLNAVGGLPQDIPVCFTDNCNGMDFCHLTFVAGQHRSAAAFSNQIAMLWLTLVHCGAMQEQELENFQDYTALLAVDSPGATRAYRVLTRYSTSDDEQFHMEPGFENFDFVEKDTLLATNRCGAIMASSSGYLLMPLCKAQGEDGFLLIIEENAS